MDEALPLNQFAVAFKFYLLHFVIYASSLLLFDANTLRYLILGNMSKSAYFTDLLVSPVLITVLRQYYCTCEIVNDGDSLHFLTVENFRLIDINLVNKTMQYFRCQFFDTEIVFYDF